jgi:DnaJ homolog subfamily C member 2
MDFSVEDKLATVDQYLDNVNAKRNKDFKSKEHASRQVAELAKMASQKEAEQLNARLKEWDEEEVRMLRKALDKFPPGTSKRWEVVQSYVRTRTVDEILDMVKHGLKKYASASMQQGSYSIIRKRQGNTEIKSEATSRLEAFTDVDINLRGEAVQALSIPSPKAAPVVTKKEASPAVESPAESDWTETEELALVKALKTVSKDAADRWEQVSTLVQTKTKTQCFQKFKLMKEKFKAKKTGAT